MFRLFIYTVLSGCVLATLVPQAVAQKKKVEIRNIKVGSEFRLWKPPKAIRDPELSVNNEMPGRDEDSSSDWER